MSKQAAIKFLEKANHDAALFAKIAKLPSSRAEAVVELAKSEGFEFSVEEFISTVLSQHSPDGELTDEELGKTAGGTVPTDPLAINLYRFVLGQD